MEGMREIDRKYLDHLEECRSLNVQSLPPLAFKKDEKPSCQIGQEEELIKVHLRSIGWETDREVLSIVYRHYRPKMHTEQQNRLTFHFKELWKATYFFRFASDNKFLADKVGQVRVWWDKDNVRPEPSEREEEVLQMFGNSDEKTEEFDLNACYFGSYGRFGIHRTMLQDQVRVIKYKNAVENSHGMFKDANVMDVGCGTGILSMFCAKAGAKQVIAVDESSIVPKTRECIKNNGFEKTIKVIKGQVENLNLEEFKKFDVIISEWMGYCLIYERMLPSVLEARDKWLKEGGKMFPNRSKVFVSGLYDTEYVHKRLGWCAKRWQTVRTPTIREICKQVIIEHIPSNCVVTNFYKICDWNLETLPIEESNAVESNFHLNLLQGTYILHGLVIHFDVVFDHGLESVILSTSPDEQKTHWKHAVLLFETPVDRAFDERKVDGKIRLETGKTYNRGLKIHLTINGTKFSPGGDYHYELK